MFILNTWQYLGELDKGIDAMLRHILKIVCDVDFIQLIHSTFNYRTFKMYVFDFLLHQSRSFDRLGEYGLVKKGIASLFYK